MNSDAGVIGYVDPNDLLAHAQQPPSDSANSFQRYTSAEEAKAALKSQTILAYYVLAPDFATSGKTDFYYWQNQPGNMVQKAFDRFARTALVDGHDAQITQRLMNGTHFILRTPDGSRTFGNGDNDIFNIIMPLVVTILFMVALFGGASYLMQAVVDEKENRTIEIVVTSVTPMQLMSGKIIGLAAVGLTQVAIWLIAGSVALAFAKTKVDFLRSATVDPAFILLAVVLSVLQYLIFGAFMAAIGSIVTDAKQGQSWSSPVILVSMLPMFFLAVILLDPNGVLSVILSLFPLTAPLALLLRYGMTSVPAWQIAAAIAIMALSAAGAMWVAARIFRIGMLRFGQRISISEIAAGIRL
jgi:ABC-2 type transport system permease protein